MALTKDIINEDTYEVRYILLQLLLLLMGAVDFVKYFSL